MPKPMSVGGINDLVIANCIQDIEERKLTNVSLIDLGIAEGYNISTLIEWTKNKHIHAQFVGIDIDTAVYIPPKETENIKLIDHDLNKDFVFGTFDYVIATEVIEHLENPYHFIRQCLKSVKPDGTVYISSPNIMSAYSALRIILLKAPAFFENDKSLEHISPVALFTFKKALALIEKETGEKWLLRQYFTNCIIKLPTFIPTVNKRSINIPLPWSSRLFSQVSYYVIKRAKNNL